MSTPEIESLRLDAAVTTKLQAIIGSDQLDDDAITAKLTELYGGRTPQVGPAAASFHEGKKVEVFAPRVGKFKGKWDKDIKDEESGGTLIQYHELKGLYRIFISVSDKWTTIVFKKWYRSYPKPADEPEEPEEPGDYDDDEPERPLPDAVFRGKGIPKFYPAVVGKGSGRWVPHRV